MRAWHVVGVALTLSGASLAAAGRQTEARQAGAEIAWLPGWDAGAAMARQNGKPLFVVFR